MAARPYDDVPTHDEFPREIVEELAASLQRHAMRTYYSLVVPNRFTVTLHTDDFERIAPIKRMIADEARRRLDEVLAELNADGEQRAAPSAWMDRLARHPWLGWLVRWFRPLAPDAPPEAIRPPSGEWFIEINPTYEEDFRPGQIDIFAQLDGAPAGEAAPLAPTAEGGRTLGPKTFAGKLKDELADVPLPTRRADAASPETSPVYATLAYEDGDGVRQTFEMKKEQITVGRGGKGYWVDLEIDFLQTDISRVHTMIRCEPATRTFEIKDVSTYGVTVNGDAMPTSHDDDEHWVPLPPSSTLVLADILTITFEAVPADA